MSKTLHQALAELVPHVDEGCQIFVLNGGKYHRFRVSDGEICHTESHSSNNVEKGRGSVEKAASLSR
jgi:hypothetical protein